MKPLILHHRDAIYALVLAPVFAAIFYSVLLLRFEGQFGEVEWDRLTRFVGWLVLAKTTAFFSVRAYRGWNRSVSFHDVIVIAKGTSIGSMLFVGIDYFVITGIALPRSVLLLDWAITILAIGALRSASRLFQDGALYGIRPHGETDVFIVGTNSSSEALLRSIRRNPKLDYHVVAFITDDPKMLGSHIEGVPIIGRIERTCELARKHEISEVLITKGDLSGQKVRELVEIARDARIKVKVLPSYEQLLHGTVDFRPRQVSIEDLLRRDPVQLDTDKLHSWICDRVLLVTGSAGSIGSEICRQLLQFRPKKLILVDRSENGQFSLERELRQLCPDAPLEVCMGDINDAARMNHLFKTYQPQIVIHAAAFKHVPMMEANPGEAVKNITIATRMLADQAHQHGVESFVMISTDKAVNPTSVMGTCKRLAELYVQSLASRSQCRFVTVRFGNVLDSAGSVVPIFRDQIAHGGPVTVTHPDMQRYFMTIPEASQLVIQAGSMGRGGEIFVLDMGEPVRIADLAADMIRLSGLKLGDDIEIEFTGMRPGEKLYEELNADGERHLRTSHSKILIAESAQPSLSAVRDATEQLAQIADGPSTAILSQLRRLVPEYGRQIANGHQSAKAA